MKNTILLVTALSVSLSTPLFARTWTDAATGRTLQGDYIRSDATHVMVRINGRSTRIEIARLSDEDKTYIKDQATPPPTDPTSNRARPDDQTVKKVSALLKSALKKEQEQEDREQATAFIQSLLPTIGAHGEDVVWKVDSYGTGGNYPKSSLMLTAYLYPKGDEEKQLMWAHILYSTEEPFIKPTEKFKGYGVMREKDAHAFLTVNRFEFRLVADDDSYKKDKHIEAILLATDLETMKKL